MFLFFIKISFSNIWVWYLDLFNSEPSYSVCRASYKGCWGLSSCISISESTSLSSSISAVGFLDPGVGKRDGNLQEREGGEEQVEELFWMEKMGVCRMGTGVGLSFPKESGTDNSISGLILFNNLLYNLCSFV